VIQVSPPFGGAYHFGILNIRLELGHWSDIGGACTTYDAYVQTFYIPLHTNLPNPIYMQKANRYDINALNQQVDLLWDYITALEKCATDVNRDTVVDVTDLLEVVADWGNICETPKGK
jgi:hypothetical protein